MKYLLAFVICYFALANASDLRIYERLCSLPDEKRIEVTRCTYDQGTRIPDIRRHCVTAIRGDLIGLEDTIKFVCNEANFKEFQFFKSCINGALAIYDKLGKNYSGKVDNCLKIQEQQDSANRWKHLIKHH